MVPPVYVRGCSAIRAADHGRRLLLLLDAGHAFLGRARDALARHDVAGFVADLARTRDVVGELVASLDPGRAADLATSLGHLHDAMLRRLALGDIERGVEAVDAMLCAYAPIVDAYREAIRHDPARSGAGSDG
jgi:flagellar biosynthetic protein FliS